jgi:hypothetical protein
MVARPEWGGRQRRTRRRGRQSRRRRELRSRRRLGTAPEAQSGLPGRQRVSTRVGRGAIIFAPTATAIGTAGLPPINGHSASLSVDGESVPTSEQNDG